MLRLIVLLLILANGLYFAWSHQIFSELGWGKTQQTEPHRLQQQINPEHVQVLGMNDLRVQDKPSNTSTSLAATSAKAPVNAQCMQTGVYNDKQVELLRAKLSALMPPNSWRFDELAPQQNWLIYMGKYANSSMFELKKAELKKMQLSFTAINEGAMALGISLGRFQNQVDANQSLNALSKRGIRTAKVVQEPITGKTYQVVFPAIGTDLIPKMNALTASFSGKSLQTCKAKP
ncbi:MAG TPA: hypothetical protein PLH13_01235 [Burkholderiaceae bacterium]|nr:hypothetical protein [Burkholderiaceae bacterium]